MSARVFESAGWYAVGFFLTQLLHETAHATAGLVLGRGPTLHTGFVEYSAEGSVAARLACSAAGPVFSLVQGLVLVPVVRRGPTRPTLRLFLTWLCFHGLVNFIGYLFTTAFAPGADLGAIAGLLGLGLPARLALTGLGYLGLRGLVRPLAPAFVGLGSAVPNAEAARAAARTIGVLAGAVATPALILAALPVPHWLSLLYVACAFLPLFDLPSAAAKAAGHSGMSPLGPARPARSIGVWVALVVLARLALDAGVRLG